MLLIILSLLISEIDSEVTDKIDVCANLVCDVNAEVCAMRAEGGGFRIKLFHSECDLLRYACHTEGKSVYDIVSMDFCIQAFKPEANNTFSEYTTMACTENDCSYLTDDIRVCGIKKDGEGFRIRLFQNECQLRKYNCDNEVEFSVTDLHICNGMEIKKNIAASDNIVDTTNGEAIGKSIVMDNITEILHDPTDDAFDPSLIDDINTKDYQMEYSTNTYKIEDGSTSADNITEILDNPTDNVNAPLIIYDSPTKTDKIENIVVVRSSLIDFNNINASVENFFAATHVFDLPVKEMNEGFLNKTTRRRLIQVARPVKVFVPWIVIPKNISDDFDHRPTLSSCYHKCPRKCPDTYAPVCGVPGIVAREPSLMFQNHCFMDVAQCKMFWENKSPTSLSSSYVESSFLFCMGDEMNGMYRFLPLIRTLQHMGRLRKKGHFHYRFHNFKFFNNMLSRMPKFMG